MNPMDVKCNKCGAPKGQGCKTLDGRPYRDVYGYPTHIDRGQK